MYSFKKCFSTAMSVSILLATLSANAFPVSAGQTLLDAGFESGMDGFGARASESVERVSTKAYEGSYSLLISNRTAAWNGAAASLGSDWKAGENYAFSCAVYQASGETVDMKLSLQYNDGSGDNWVQIAEGPVSSDKWTILSNDKYMIPAGAASCVLYVETAESLCDFYVDSIYSEIPSAEPPKPTFSRGDVNHDGGIDKKDVADLTGWLLTKGGDSVNLDTSDMDKDGILTAADLSLLRQFFIYPELTRTTTTTTVTTTTTTTTAPPVNNEVWPELKPGDKWYNTADVSWIPAGKKTVALSFDDGPCPNGENYGIRIQQALNKQGFHATFFYWGERIPGHESEILSAEAGGHEVANHTWNHPDNYNHYDSAGVLSQYNRVKDKLNEILGVKRDYLLRLPYLNNSTTISSTLPVPFPNCGINTADYEPGHTAQQTISTIQQAAQNGSLNGKVVLMHEVYEETAKAVESLAPWLAQNGDVVCTVSEMFKYNGKDMYAGRTYDSCF